MRRQTGRPHGARRAALVTVGLFLALLVEQAPHLVHHLFEPAHRGVECVFAVGADHTHAVAGEAISLAVPRVAVPARPGSVSAVRHARVRAHAAPRAPPPVAS